MMTRIRKKATSKLLLRGGCHLADRREQPPAFDLPELGGADKLRKLNVPVRRLISFEGH